MSTGFESVSGETQSSPYIVRPTGDQSLVVFQCAVRNPLITTGDHSSVAQQFFKVLGRLQRRRKVNQTFKWIDCCHSKFEGKGRENGALVYVEFQ